MKVLTVSEQNNDERRKFFQTIFQDGQGYIGVASLTPAKKFREEFFFYPNDLDNLLEWVNRSFHGQNLYFCPQLLLDKRRKKDQVSVCYCLWSDLDTAHPEDVQPAPNLWVESSPGRYQGYWTLTEPLEPLLAEDLSHRIAYHHRDKGVDSSGWDLTQLLRIPLTYNAKHKRPGEIPIVEVLKWPERHFDRKELDIPELPGEAPIDEEVPDVSGFNREELLETYARKLPDAVTELLQITPPLNADWSSTLWRLETTLFEAGMSKEQVFFLCRDAACNKFKRDGLPETYLWQDVARAYSRNLLRIAHVITSRTELSALLTTAEAEYARKTDTFIDQYVEWAKSKGDAAPQYHEAGAFVVLSALTSGAVSLPTSFGTIIPNLWFMLLADTTLTRKTTAMDISIELLNTVDNDSILATDGSIEGLMQGLSTRPRRPSIFLRDEFTGMIEAMAKRDYYAGMIEVLTKLYDGKYQKRILRREIIEVRDPILIFFCGGVRSKLADLLDHVHITSGFFPRFIIITAESDITRLRPLGPATPEQDQGRSALVQKMQDLKNRFDVDTKIMIGDQEVTTKKTWEAVLTPEAWKRYNLLETTMVGDAIESEAPEIMTPTMDRLAKSGLKVATLLAASRMEDHVVVEESDIVKAIEYVQRWRSYTIDIISGVGQSSTERKVDAVYRTVIRHGGVTRSKLMQYHHLTARDADWIIETLDQRGLVTRVRRGRTEELHPVTG